MPNDDEWVAEEHSEDVLKALSRIVDKHSPHSPYFDNMHEYHRRAEIAIVQDWAKEMRRSGHAVCEIRSHDDDPPDVLAVMDGIQIGIEVTILVEYVRDQQVGARAFLHDSPREDGESRAVPQGASQSIPKFVPVAYEWTLGRFQIRLREIARRKDKQARAKKEKRVREQGEDALERRLRQRILLIFTAEIYLQDYLAEYLAKTELSRPENFDHVFVMGDYVPDGASGFHPVIEVSLS